MLEASRNTALDPVPVKSPEQQAIAALHRLRQGYLQTRTARINAVRGHLREFGVVIPVGARHVVARAASALDVGDKDVVHTRASSRLSGVALPMPR